MKNIFLSVALLASVAGCASRDAQMVAAPTVSGAAVGCIIGAIIAGDEGCAYGAGAGALAGGAVGAYSVYDTQSIEREAAALNSETRRLSQLLDREQRRLAELENKLRHQTSAYFSERERNRQLRTGLAQYQRRDRQLRQSLSQLERSITIQWQETVTSYQQLPLSLQQNLNRDFSNLANRYRSILRTTQSARGNI